MAPSHKKAAQAQWISDDGACEKAFFRGTRRVSARVHSLPAVLQVIPLGRVHHERKSGMNAQLFRRAFAIVVVILVSVFVLQTRSAQSTSAPKSQDAPKPLLLEKNEG